jgi:DNA-directed RNA polymerase specialized sigma24 family protein
LQPTALVNESCLKLHGFAFSIVSREHFFRLSARAMKQVLTDRGRAQACRKANSRDLEYGLRQETRSKNSESRLIARDILDRFERIDRVAAGIVRLRYMEGYSWQEVSRLTGREVWQVRSDAEFALDWMRDHLR